jgi:hypothetical protein
MMIITKYVLTPILVPLRGKSCKEDPNSFYCTCVLREGLQMEVAMNLMVKSFLQKLVAALGTFL